MTVTAAPQAQPDPARHDPPAASAAGWQNLAVLHAMPDQQACVSDLTTAAHLPQPMVSHHLQILYRAALITRTGHGSRFYYQLNQHELHTLAQERAAPQEPPADSSEVGP